MDEPERTNPDRLTRPLALVLTVLAGVLRFVRFWPNFSPIGALGLFGGARLRGWQAFIIPLVLMLVTNAILAVLNGGEYFFYRGLPFVCASFLLYVLIGRCLQGTENPLWVGAASLLGSIQFYLLTNFGHWLVMGVAAGSAAVLEPGQYYLTFAGLIECYVQAIPFFGTTLLSDLTFTAAFFGLHAILTRVYFVAERVPIRKGMQ
jgi:hypothetical protein